MIVLLLYFLLLFIVLQKKKSIAMILVTIQIISLIGTFFIGRFVDISTIEDLSRIFIIMLLLSLIILPWKYYYGIQNISPISLPKLKVITKVLIGINIFVFIVFLITTIVVLTTVQDVNAFKYAEGVSTDFYYNKLPIPVVFFNISIFLYYFSYFMLPLHFYYLHKNQRSLAIVCFVLSLNIILYGLTFFSRSVIVQYMFLYTAMLFLLYGTLSARLKRTIKVSTMVVGIIALIYFVDISQRRFEEGGRNVNLYANTIPPKAAIQDPLTFSYLDYTSQGFLNGYEVLELYKGEGFHGTLTLHSLLSFFNTKTDSYNSLKLRRTLWPDFYSYSFNGFTAYAIYDYGIFGSVLFCLIYFFIIKKMKPDGNQIKLKNLFLVALLVQIPLMSIFYSQMGGLLIAFILWIPLWIYINNKIRL